MTDTPFTEEVRQALLAPFPLDEVDFRGGSVKDGKALAFAFIDARAVQNRLDMAVGPGNWSFDYQVVDTECKRVKGMLTIFGVTRCDAGEADKEEEPLKSAVSDAIKRCAVQFGIGRYLYYLPMLWWPCHTYTFQGKEKFGRWQSPPSIKPVDAKKACQIIGWKGEAKIDARLQRDQEPEGATVDAKPAPPKNHPAGNRSGARVQGSSAPAPAASADRPALRMVGREAAEPNAERQYCSHEAGCGVMLANDEVRECRAKGWPMRCKDHYPQEEAVLCSHPDCVVRKVELTADERRACREHGIPLLCKTHGKAYLASQKTAETDDEKAPLPSEGELKAMFA